MNSKSLSTEYLESQEKVAEENQLLRQLFDYYSLLHQPVLVADLDEISFVVESKQSGGMNSGLSRLPFYAPITEDVLNEMLSKYDTKLPPPSAETIADSLYALSLSEPLPLKSVKSCLDMLITGDFIDLLEGADS